jgi:hypothetical protein
MNSIRMTLVVAGVLFAATLLAGCQSTELAACKDKTALLERRMVEYQQVVDMRDKEIKDKNDEIQGLVDKVAKCEVKIALLEKENEDLHIAIAKTPDSSKRIIEGVGEIKRMQREAAEKLKKQQAAADANQPK